MRKLFLFHKRKLKYAIFAVMTVLLLSIWIYFAWKTEISQILLDTSIYFRDTVHLLEKVPLICYSLIIFILPIFFLPVTPIFVLAAARVTTDSYLIVLFYCLLGVTMNVIVSYFLSHKFGNFLRRKLVKHNIHIPEIPQNEQYELTFLMRMIPGNPLAVQNYVLGVANISFFKYVVVSLPIQYVQIAAYVYFGEGVFEGGLSKIILGVSFLFVVAIIARILDKHYGHKLRKKIPIKKITNQSQSLISGDDDE